MTLTNPAGDAVNAAATYTKALLDILGDRDPLAVLRATPARLREIATSVDDDRLRRAEGPGKWSMLQVAQHLADSELVCAWRYRLAVAQDGAPITPYDQDIWMATLWHGDERIDDVLAQFDVARTANLRLLSRLTPEEWQHAGLHAERGRETVRHQATLAAGHDLVHLRQIERVRAGVAGT
jgi:hypothetical protein